MPSSSHAFQFGTAVIALIGQYLQRLGFKGIFCSLCHRMELVDVAAVVHHFACDNQLVLVINDCLYIVARNALAAFDQ